MKWLVRTGVVLLGIVVGLWAVPELKISSGDTVSTTIRYVALGDSIAHGYGLTNPREDSYVGQVENYLENYYDYVITANFGTDGLRSGELLDILINPENEFHNKYAATLKYADIVTVSVGSNDLLRLLRLDIDIQEYIARGDVMFRDACQTFDENFPKIIEAIKRVAPAAKIYADNVYNPCHGLGKYENLYEKAEYYIDMLNQTFIKGSGYTLVDIKSGFENSEEKLVNMAFKGREFDPHPNKKGHLLIGQLVIKAIQAKGF
ncbi:MAG: SGNH/GDSL hydrolase family protein [Lachnospiraceae bacterium]|nr:SGNH/GDSL hydrolase family protein [Lachnospiraceae bacterium]